MAATNEFEQNALKLILQNINWANVGDATGLRGSSTAGVVYISLHTANPGATGDQTTSEATYPGYARVAVNRDNTAWTVSGGAPAQAVNASTIAFAPCTAGSNTLTYFGVGTAISGTGHLLIAPALTAPLAVSAGITPTFAASALVLTCS